MHNYNTERAWQIKCDVSIYLNCIIYWKENKVILYLYFHTKQPSSNQFCPFEPFPGFLPLIAPQEVLAYSQSRVTTSLSFGVVMSIQILPHTHTHLQQSLMKSKTNIDTAPPWNLSTNKHLWIFKYLWLSPHKPWSVMSLPFQTQRFFLLSKSIWLGFSSLDND